MTTVHFCHNSQRLIELVKNTDSMMKKLTCVYSLNLDSWCIGAGAVRNMVWDALHGYKNATELADVDVAFFDPDNTLQQQDDDLQSRLTLCLPGIPWEVTNQAGVHHWYAEYFKQEVEPLSSLEDAIATWPEYATSVGVYLNSNGEINIIAPHGLDDLFNMIIRRNPTRVSVQTYKQRTIQKNYKEKWPNTTVIMEYPE